VPASRRSVTPAIAGTAEAAGRQQLDLDDARQTRGDWTQKFLDAQTKAPAGAPDFTTGLMQQFNDQTKELAASAPSPEARAAFEERLSLFGEDLAAKATVFEGTERVRKRRNDLADTIDLNAATVRKDVHQYDETRTETLAAIQASDLPAADKDEVMRAPVASWRPRKSTA